jgi:hypothetical protein
MEWSVPSSVWWLAGALGVAVAIFGGWWLWWWVPKQQVKRLKFAIRDPKARVDVEDKFRKTIGQLLGGAAVLIGAGLSLSTIYGTVGNLSAATGSIPAAIRTAAAKRPSSADQQPSFERF